MRPWFLHHLFRRARHNHQASSIPALGAQIDDPVCHFDHVHVVFDDQYRVALVDEPLKGTNEFSCVVKVQPCRGFIENEKPRVPVAGLQVSRQFESLGLPS